MMTKVETLLKKRRGKVAVSGWVKFGQEAPRSIEVVMHPDEWEEMGRPDTITVTVEVGDQLNADN